MKIYEILGGINIIMSNDEQALMDKIENNKVLKRNLNPRERELASKMCSKGLLNRVRVQGKLAYKANASQDLWRTRWPQ